MKRIYLILTVSLISVSAINAQYRINKNKYDYHTYSYEFGDPYNPSVMGFASLIVPGFGQMLSGEGGRGIAFFCGNLSLIVIKRVSFFTGWGSSKFENYMKLNSVIRIGKIGIHAWSAFDASRIAKVNNLVFRDRNNTTYNLQLLPYLETLENLMIAEKPAAGLTVSITF